MNHLKQYTRNHILPPHPFCVAVTITALCCDIMDKMPELYIQSLKCTQLCFKLSQFACT